MKTVKNHRSRLPGSEGIDEFARPDYLQPMILNNQTLIPSLWAHFGPHTQLYIRSRAPLIRHRLVCCDIGTSCKGSGATQGRWDPTQRPGDPERGNVKWEKGSHALRRMKRVVQQPNYQ